MSVELGDDSTYPMRGVVSISFHVSSGDVLELDDILFVHGLKKNLLQVSCMTNVHWRVAFEGQQCIIVNFSLTNLRTLARGVRNRMAFANYLLIQ